MLQILFMLWSQRQIIEDLPTTIQTKKTWCRGPPHTLTNRILVLDQSDYMYNCITYYHYTKEWDMFLKPIVFYQ